MAPHRGRNRKQTIGVIADTHGLFDPAIMGHFKDVDHIVHAGDIGKPSVIERLEGIAPVTAVSGNVDTAGLDKFPTETVIELAGFRIAIRHVIYERGKLTKEGRAFLDRERPDICIFGHTHQPRIERLDGMLLFNPGSAGPKRFKLPRSLGLLRVAGKKILPRLLALPDRAGSHGGA